MPTLHERRDVALAQAMDASKRAQDARALLVQAEQDMLKAAGAIDLLDTLIAEETSRG